MRDIRIDPHDAIIDGTCNSQRRSVVARRVRPASGWPEAVTRVFAVFRSH